MSEKILVGADHAGFALKQRIVDELKKLGHQPVDLGPDKLDPADDYPDFAKRVAAGVSKGEAKLGVLTCGTGIGMAMAANRYPGVRAAVVWSPEVAELSRKHNDANVLTIPAWSMDEDDVLEALRRWLATTFEGGRHARRVQKIER
ncbi:MAG: RpiB/LacA/LacB family sugar-phosphate isomerase [Gemmatimonadales bacterium]